MIRGMSTEAPGLQQRAPTAAQMRTFALLSAVYIALTLAVVPWARLPGPSDPHIVVIYGLAVLVADLCTALMLGALYRGSRRGAHLLLGCAYLYSGLMAGAHMASFRGAVFEAPLFGNEQTVSWLFLAWRVGTAALFLSALLLARKDPGAQDARPGRRLLVASLLTLAVTVALIALAAQVRVEGIVGGRFTELGTQIQWGAVVLYAAAFALLWGKRAFGDLLYLWVGLVLVASIADLTLSNLGGGRYTIGWHAARVNLSISACLLLAFLLGDAVGESRAMAKVAGISTYGGALAVTLTAVLMRWALDPWLGFAVPYSTLYGAVAIAVWFGGLGPAVMAMVLGYAIINVRYISPQGELAVNGPADAISLALFALSSSLIIVLGEAMRRARDRYRASEVELKERAAQLQRADAKKSQFLAVLSHELRNPLAPLLNGVMLLRMQQPREDAATAETHDMMERQIVQLTRLIDDLLDVSRVDRGKLELRTETVAINAVMRTGAETAKPNIDAKGHALAVSYPEAPLHVQGDPVRLAQVVANLLNNAAKFTPPKGRIELAARAEDGRVVLCVADDGIGIAPEHLHEVFDMFVQVDTRHVAASGGLGLGLTLARAIVRRHGGEIEATSRGRGKGSEFTVRLPLVTAPEAAQPEAAPAEPPVRRRVLVVDDNVDAAQTLAQYLRLTGHRVESALDGEAALRIAEVLHPDVAFIDLNMPRMDGAEVARRLRLTPWGRSARLVALTGMGQQADIERTREAGFDEHITKPADLQRLSRLAAGV
jgi:signal transduction histidine kinase/CheY-like chemotaxis protein